MGIRYDREEGKVLLTSGRLELRVDIREGLNPCGLTDLKSGRSYADSDYEWAGNDRPVPVEEPALHTLGSGDCEAVFLGKTGGLRVKMEYCIQASEADVIFETITISNPTANMIDTSAFACGFAKTARMGADRAADVAEANLCEIPYRYHNETGELRDCKIPEFLQKESWYSSERSPRYNMKQSTAYGSEAWAWYGAGTVLLFSKYNADAMEWSIIEKGKKIKDGHESTLLRFGGAARWKLGDPEGAASLAPGASFTFGETRYSVLDGGLKQAFADFRQYTQGKGHRLPDDFDPPVHWNELYDNPYWWAVTDRSWHSDNTQELSRYYRLKDMEAEIQKAHEIGCGCFYLDPGWDTSFCSNIWDEGRLGRQADFALMLKEKYGMKLALHTPLAPWANHDSYPQEARQMESDGTRRDDLCVASSQYMDIKVERLEELCKNGAYFLMYDGSWYDKPCYDPNHGHGVPSTRQEHVDAILTLARRLHEAYPDVIIEQHDPITGPGTPRYAPTYFMHGKAGAFDELWGSEYMIDPMADIVSHRAFSLYGFNLAYTIPIYLHIDLRKDNARALMFWWYASTCRHLGIGGRHEDPLVWKAHKQAMKIYLQNKRFFAQGIFYGIDELTHAHTLPDAGECVINCFSLEEEPVKRALHFSAADIGLADGRLEVTGCRYTAKGAAVSLEVEIPAMGHTMIRVKRFE
ncbi:MAG: hypothetical protein P4M02_01715 [Clostridia bacterium]|nr:hypothetical protein [Clostridia bacterium]